MPILTMKTTAQLTDVQAASLMQQLTRLAGQVLNKRESVTACVFQTIAPAQWRVGGQQPSQILAELSIQVTQGTNDADQKQRFVAQAYEALQSVFVDVGLHPVCYVTVLEVPAQNWGYAGQTQHQRSQASG